MLGAIVFVIILSVLIVVHEFGHFIAARRAGVKVERFAIGFGPPLITIKGKQTDFLICLFLLGGYVKLAGDSRAEQKGKDYEFLSKPVGVRSRIVFFGPLFNYFLAIVVFCAVYMIGFPHLDTFVGQVKEGYPAQEANIQAGDKILSINGKDVDNWIEVTDSISGSKGLVTLVIERDSQVLEVSIMPTVEETVDVFGAKVPRRLIGIAASDKVKIVRQKNIFVAFYKGIEATLKVTFSFIKGIIYIILGRLPLKKSVGGIIAIYGYASTAAKLGLSSVLSLIGSISVCLAIVNLLPCPVLDGGHLLFFFMEKIRRKPLTQRTEDLLTRIGMVALLLLFAFIMYNDILRLLEK